MSVIDRCDVGFRKAFCVEWIRKVFFQKCQSSDGLGCLRWKRVRLMDSMGWLIYLERIPPLERFEIKSCRHLLVSLRVF